MTVHYYFHHSPTHTLWPNFFIPPIFCTHVYSLLKNISIKAHMFSALWMPCWYTKMLDKKSETLTNNWNTKLTYHSYITYFKLEPQKIKHFVDDNKYNNEDKLPILNSHHQNTNRCTVQMLIMLLQWLCTVVKTERVNLVIHDSNGFVIKSVAWYTYIYICVFLLVQWVLVEFVFL